MSEIKVYKVCRIIIGEDGNEKYMSATNHPWKIEYPLNGYAEPVEGGLFAFMYQDNAETFMRSMCGYTYVLFRAYGEPYDTSTTLAVDISYTADDNVLNELMSNFWSKHNRNDVGFENLLTVPVGTIFMKTLRITEELLRYNDAH